MWYSIFVIHITRCCKAYFGVEFFEVMLRADPDRPVSEYLPAVFYGKPQQLLPCAFAAHLFCSNYTADRHFVIGNAGRHEPCISYKLFVFKQHKMVAVQVFVIGVEKNAILFNDEYF